MVSDGYTNRANIRVALKKYEGAVADYTRALELAPLAKDRWVTLLNRGATLNKMGRRLDALNDLERAVPLAQASRDNQARFALLGRADVYHSLGRYGEAAADLAAVVELSPVDVQPFWLRLALDNLEAGRRAEGLGIARRVAAKFDLEPETNLAICSMLWRDGTEVEHEEALRRYAFLPTQTKERMEVLDYEDRGWPPNAEAAARKFLREAKPQAQPADALTESSGPAPAEAI